ncbi:MAG: penicillin-binding protein 2 [Oceanococcaceae bacterium]
MLLTEGREQLQDFRLRQALAMVSVLLLAGTLGVRMWMLQSHEHDSLAERADRNRTAELPLPGVRGLIYDHRGVVLADNVPSWQLQLVPERITDVEALIAELRVGVSLQPHELQRFHDRRRSNRAFQPIPLKFNLSQDELAWLEVHRDNWPGVRVEATLARRYPLNTGAAHLIGYVGGVTAKDLASDTQDHYRGISHIGKTGIERSYEDMLRPISGTQWVESDARGRRLRELRSSAPTPGWDLHLTLDAELQRTAVAALEGQRGAAVVLDLRQGDVLALASAPSFDPHWFIDGISHARYAQLVDDPGNPLFNRAIQGRYPPGSTIKPMLALAGLEYGLVNADDHVNCIGWYQLPGQSRRYRDWKRRGHGRVNLRTSVAQSCDVYYYDLANTMGIERLASFAGRFGVGSLTGVALPAEDAGILPSPAWKRGALGEVWYPGETLNIGIGQGYMLTTPLQLAVMTARIATRGEGYAPRLVRSRSRDGQTLPEPASPLPPISLRETRHWQAIHESMRAVVHSADGTARSVGQGLPFQVAGKTGTAQVAGLSQEDDKAPQLEDVPLKLRDHALFVAYAPAAAPEIALAVIVENSGSGSAVAAPVARKLIDNWLLRCDGVAWRPWCLEVDI